mmetsp:Transcript_123303/g.213799  ORF Transcript_123303/g.213799 Transcript_123303/m.213799 type:complete len:103 (-) Transcript_123303:17-325(-)
MAQGFVWGHAILRTPRYLPKPLAGEPPLLCSVSSSWLLGVKNDGARRTWFLKKAQTRQKQRPHQQNDGVTSSSFLDTLVSPTAQALAKFFGITSTWCFRTGT